MQDLAAVLERLDAIGREPSRNIKEAMVRDAVAQSDLFRKVVLYAMDAARVYGIKALSPPQKQGIAQAGGELPELFQTLDLLAQASGASHSAKQHLADLAHKLAGEQGWELVLRIVTKDLRCGVGVKTWAKYIPELPIHEVQLCGALEYLERPDGSFIEEALTPEYNKYLKRIGGPQNVMLSDKFDGVRVWAFCTATGDGSWNMRYVSRNGKEYPNFACFDDSIRHVLRASRYRDERMCVLDGEVVDRTGQFTDLMSQVRTVNRDIDASVFVFRIFDHFVPGIPDPFHIRYGALVAMMPAMEYGNLAVLEHTRVSSLTVEELIWYFKKALGRKQEGLILKDANAPYLPDDRRAWMKLKQFHTEDLPVIGWEYGEGKNANRVGKLVCLYQGEEVRVSGMSDAQRVEFMTNTPKLIEVKFQETSMDKDGKISLRFPSFLRVREDKD